MLAQEAYGEDEPKIIETPFYGKMPSNENRQKYQGTAPAADNQAPITTLSEDQQDKRPQKNHPITQTNI